MRSRGGQGKTRGRGINFKFWILNFGLEEGCARRPWTASARRSDERVIQVGKVERRTWWLGLECWQTQCTKPRGQGPVAARRCFGCRFAARCLPLAMPASGFADLKWVVTTPTAFSKSRAKGPVRSDGSFLSHGNTETPKHRNTEARGQGLERAANSSLAPDP